MSRNVSEDLIIAFQQSNFFWQVSCAKSKTKARTEISFRSIGEVYASTAKITIERRLTFAWIDISFARFYFYECAENLLSFARFNCAVFNYIYRRPGHLTG